MRDTVFELTKGMIPYMLGILGLAVIFGLIRIVFSKAEKKVDNIIDDITSEKCPMCGNKLVRKKGKFGYFIGCSNYPNCKFTKDLENKR